MDNRDRSIHIRCFDTCHYHLAYPQFFLEVPKATLRKILKWLFQFDWYRENEETIAFLDRELPSLPQIVEAESKTRTKKQAIKDLKRAKEVFEIYQIVKSENR